MSGPAPADAALGGEPAGQQPLEVLEGKEAQVGSARVRRALPLRRRRTVGAWCFADHLGPMAGPDQGLDIGPHPHTGLATVTWLLEGELLHRDSLGSEQPVAPGQLNLMHAGRGVSHAEEQVRPGGRMHGAQLWVAQPEATRHGDGGFEHHGDLPQAEVPGGVATVLIGALAGATSPARADTPLLGADLALQAATSTWGLEPSYEHALVVLDGAVVVDDTEVVPGQLAHLGTGRQELVLTADAPARVLLLGGEPFEAPLVMWWNWVGRTREEMVEAHRAWAQDDGRFGRVDSRLPRIPAPNPPWSGQ